MADEVKGKLARRVQERERETEALIEQPTDPVSKAQKKEDEDQAWMGGPVALIWIVAIVIGLVTGSVSLGLAAFVVFALVLGFLIVVRRAPS
ncbi:MAG: hypothetical protein WB507_07515 [Solirubrobacterales bacterium]